MPKPPTQNLPRGTNSLALGPVNCLAFVNKVSQSLAKVLNINRKLHWAYRSQSSGQVERKSKTQDQLHSEISQALGQTLAFLNPLGLGREEELIWNEVEGRAHLFLPV